MSSSSWLFLQNIQLFYESFFCSLNEAWPSTSDNVLESINRRLVRILSSFLREHKLSLGDTTAQTMAPNKRNNYETYMSINAGKRLIWRQKKTNWQAEANLFCFKKELLFYNDLHFQELELLMSTNYIVASHENAQQSILSSVHFVFQPMKDSRDRIRPTYGAKTDPIFQR